MTQIARALGGKVIDATDVTDVSLDAYHEAAQEVKGWTHTDLPIKLPQYRKVNSFLVPDETRDDLSKAFSAIRDVQAALQDPEKVSAFVEATDTALQMFMEGLRNVLQDGQSEES